MRIVLADDHPMILRGVRTTLAEQDDLEVVAEVSTGEEAVLAIEHYRPDLLLLDLSMPGPGAEEIVTQGRQAHPELKVLILTAYGDDYHLLKVSHIPISGYLIKDEAPEHLLQAVRVIGQGAVWFSQSVVDRIRGFRQVEQDKDVCGPSALTVREREVLELIARGLDNQVIARRLSLAEQTVRNYASTVYHKIGVISRMEALVWAREHGLVSTDPSEKLRV